MINIQKHNFNFQFELALYTHDEKVHSTGLIN